MLLCPEYLGHIISREGASPDLEKNCVMIAWPTPTIVKQLCVFLGPTSVRPEKKIK